MMRIPMLASIVAASSAALLVTATGSPAGAADAAGHHSTAAAAAATTESWSQANGDGANSRSNLGEHTLRINNVSKLRFLRSYTAPPTRPKDGCGGQAPPAISGGDVTAVVNGYLVHYAAKSGTVLWSHPFIGGANDVPSAAVELVVAHGEVIVESVYCGSVSAPDEYLDAFSATSGKKLWDTGALNVCTNGQCSTEGGEDGNYTELLVAGKYLVAEGDAEGGLTLAVHKVSTGAQVWKALTTPCGQGAASVVHGQVIFGLCADATPNALEARALATGSHTWRLSGNGKVLRGDSAGSAGEHVLVADSHGVVQDLNPLTGASQGALPGAVNVLAVDATQAYATCGDKDEDGYYANLCAYSLTSHKQVWDNDSSDIGYVTNPDTPLAAEAGGVLYLNTGVTLNTTTGTPLQLDLGYGGTSDLPIALAVGDGRLVVTDADQRIVDTYGLPGE